MKYYKLIRLILFVVTLLLLTVNFYFLNENFKIAVAKAIIVALIIVYALPFVFSLLKE